MAEGSHNLTSRRGHANESVWHLLPRSSQAATALHLLLLMSAVSLLTFGALIVLYKLFI
ncbi:MAG TPA: hypothetical protein VE968_03510 [Sphingomicrobium sp.]|nr:hypothetical protein [Sphingomicrobium sp.]